MKLGYWKRKKRKKKKKRKKEKNLQGVGVDTGVFIAWMMMTWHIEVARGVGLACDVT